MLTHSRNKHWLRILDLSNQMYAFAKKEEWQMVQEIETERQKKIIDFFSSGINENEAEDMADNIKSLLQSDKELLGAGLQAKCKISESLGILGKSKKVAGAYAAHADL
jgi:hypothetical protein